MADAVTPRKRRWLKRILAIAFVAPLIAIAILPWLLSRGPAKDALVAFANRSIAPSRVEVGALRLSWLGSLRMSNVVLHDPRGKRVAAIPRATLNRGLIPLLLDRSKLGTLTLERPSIDVERRIDGSIDVAEIVPKGEAAAAPEVAGPAPSSGGIPDVDLTLKVVRGSIRVMSPELTEPLTADRFDLTVQATAAPGPMNLKLRMEKGAESEASTLGVDGTYDLRAKGGTPADLAFNVRARRWAFGASIAGVTARGQLDGQLAGSRKKGLWGLLGDAKLLGLDVAGPALQGDRLRLDRVAGVWDVEQGVGAWSVRRMNLTSPVGTLSASAPLLGTPGTAASIEGRIDLAALARQVPHALRIRDGMAVERGEARVRFEHRTEAVAGGQILELTAMLSDLVAHDASKTVALRTPASLAAQVRRHGANLTVERFTIASEFLHTDGAGDLDRGIKVTGSLDLGALQAQLRDLIDFGAVELAGRGEFNLDYRRAVPSFAGTFTSEFRGLGVKGLTTEPIHRDALKLEAAVSGPIAPNGLPRSLGEARVGLAAGQVAAYATSTIQDSGTAMTLVAGGPLTLSEQVDGAPRADVKFQGAWRAPALEIGDLRLNLRPADAPPQAVAVALAVRGRYDSSKGEVTLNPIPGTGTAPGAVGLAGEGLHVSGLGRPGNVLKVEADLMGDLAALDHLLVSLRGGERYDVAGGWSGRVSVAPTADGRLRLAARLDAPDVTRGGAAGQGRSHEGPHALAFKGAYRSEGGRLEIEELGLLTGYASIAARGQVDDAVGRRVADLEGTLAPNWKALNTMVAAAVEPGASLQGGGPRPFRIKGPLSGSSTAEVLKGLDAELGVDLAGAQAYGLKLGPTPLVLRCGGGRAAFVPIVTTMNNGKVDLRPDLALDDPRGLALRLLPGSSIRDAEINDEVSQKVLSYIAPILEQATQVHGRVSAGFDRAEFPIGGDDRRTMTVNGNIVFNDVAFGAGPLGGELLSLVGKGPETALRLHQPVQLAIANRRISQSGLEIPISREAKITIRGSVGFDKTLSLRADVPITGAMLGRDKTLQNLVAGTTIPVPIGGTLSHPRADRRAIGAAVKEVSKSLLKRGVEQEANDLLKRLTRDRGTPRPRQ